MNVLHVLNLNTPIHRLNALTKIIIVACLWITAFSSLSLIVVFAIILFNLVLWYIARIPLSEMKLMIGTVIILGSLMVIAQGFVYYSNKTILFYIFKWPFYAEGAIFGVTIAMRLLAIVSTLPLLTMTTPISPFMAALAALKLPYKFIFIIGTSMRLTPLVLEVFEEIRDAQRLRGHNIKKMNIIKKFTKGYYPILIPLLLSLLRKTGDMDIAMESRGFGAPVKRTYLEDISLKRLDYLALGITLGFCAFMFWLPIYMGWGAGLAGWGGGFGGPTK